MATQQFQLIVEPFHPPRLTYRSATQIGRALSDGEIQSFHKTRCSVSLSPPSSSKLVSIAQFQSRLFVPP